MPKSILLAEAKNAHLQFISVGVVFNLLSFICYAACPVCYISAVQARASIPCTSSASPVLRNLTYVVDENPIKIESHGGSEFGGYPSLKQRSESFDMQESMTVHCG